MVEYAKEIQWLIREKYGGVLTAKAKKDIERIKKGEPVDFVIGFAEFAGCVIDLSFRPLIPRSETEYWVFQAVEDIQNSAKKDTRTPCPVRVLDLFSGSGCVGMALLKHIPRAVVDFAEKDKKLLSQIRLNIKKGRADQLFTTKKVIKQRRYRVIYSDVFSGIRGEYDYILANPPYIAESRKNRVQSSVLKYEPKEALFAGKDGLSVIKRFLASAKKYLAKQGKIYLEFDSPQKPAIEKLLKRHGYSRWHFFKDQYSKWRFVVISSL
ncbi:MAG: HemK family protein methyltransferase [Candidatus Wildermuthbacteria bacterium]|nr:HemK family protein methyltransferase [Candidatus Wildermuthbacteria bacterium]